MQGTVQELKQQMKHSQGVRARLVAVRGEKERARVNLKVAQEAKEEATAALQQVLNGTCLLEEKRALPWSSIHSDTQGHSRLVQTIVPWKRNWSNKHKCCVTCIATCRSAKYVLYVK